MCRMIKQTRILNVKLVELVKIDRNLVKEHETVEITLPDEAIGYCEKIKFYR